MKSIKMKAAAALMSAFLFVSCQNSAGGDDDNGNSGNGNSNTPKSEYTVTFDNNCPVTYDGGNFWSCSEYAPEAVKAEEGSYITLPEFTGELTRYVSNEKEGDYPFEKWNTKSDGSGDSYVAGASFQVTQDITFYAVYSSEKKSNGSSGGAPDGDYLDLSSTSEYAMKIGEKIQLYVENADSYSVTTGDDVVSIDSDNVMEAVGAGSATVQVTVKDSVQTYSVVVTVSADTTNSSFDAALIGKWVDGKSYLQFNSDGSGYFYFIKNSTATLDSSCSWTVSNAGGKKWIVITGAPSDTNGSYEYSISGSTLYLTGRMAFLMASSSNWTKE